MGHSSIQVTVDQADDTFSKQARKRTKTCSSVSDLTQ
jgi:hypothetical protein